MQILKARWVYNKKHHHSQKAGFVQLTPAEERLTFTPHANGAFTLRPCGQAAVLACVSREAAPPSCTRPRPLVAAAGTRRMYVGGDTSLRRRANVRDCISFIAN